MPTNRTARKSGTRCAECPLRKLDGFRAFTDAELSFVEGFKAGELIVEPGVTLLSEGAHSAHLFTLREGWAYRQKTLEDGRRQVLNYALPGDLIGLQAALMSEMQHSVVALSALNLCVFERGRIKELFANHPGLAFDITWIASREERLLDEHLLSVGRRTALERAAYLLAFLARRAQSTGMASGARVRLPVTQSLVADTLGLSVVHTNKTIRKLASRGLVRWMDRGCEVLDIDGLAALANWDYEPSAGRPYI